MLNEDILLQVQKPARYLGREWNVSRKEFDKAAIKFALCFPDMYEVGMSNLGIRILYGILNKQEDTVCERLFSPGTDLENLVRGGKTDLVSLESQRKLREFDIVGFSLGSELCYTNVLNILDLAGIPLRASDRDEKYPLVMAGGPCVLNPEPMHEFIDAFVIGEAEEAALELLEVYRKSKAAKTSKQDLLFALSQIEGVYVPSLYEAIYSAEGVLEEFKPQVKGVPVKVSKRVVKDFDASFFPVDWLVPYIQTVHDRITLEITRGCPNQCRFCQARSGYYPFRYRRVDRILGLAQDCYKRTGYEEVSLSGLSVSDYPGLEELLKGMTDLFQGKAVSLSLPSVRPKLILGPIASLIAGIKKTGLTFAPEAGSSRLRQIIGKDFDEADFFATLEQAFASGYQRVKLYFMIGLPQEGEEDLSALIGLANKVSELRRKSGAGPAFVNISVNPFVPKPHTSLQWLGMEREESLKNKQDFLRSKAKNRRLAWNFHHQGMSLLEAALSRGDRRLSPVIEAAFLKGARFDAWSQYFNFDIWKSVFVEQGLDLDAYLRQRSLDERLPWDFIDVGVSHSIFVQEFKKAVAIK
jgi:radical SAM family uncharacterized protein